MTPHPTPDNTSNATKAKPRGKPFGAPGHPLTPRDAGLRGAAKTVQMRRERAQALRDRLRERIEADDQTFELVWSAYERGLRADDPKTSIQAANALAAQAYGNPAQEIHASGAAPTIVLMSAFQSVSSGEIVDQEAPELEAGAVIDGEIIPLG